MQLALLVSHSLQLTAAFGVKDSMQALAEDHLNDIASNIGAAVTAAIAGMFDKAWSVDPIGAIFISAWIVWRWHEIARSQV